MRYANIRVGDPAPWFHAECGSNPRFAFDTAAGRYIVMCFLGAARDAPAAAAIKTINENRAAFDDARASFFGVTNDPSDRDSGRLKEALPGIRYFLDFDAAIARAYGAIPDDVALNGNVRIRRFWMVVSPSLRVMRVIPFGDGAASAAEVLTFVKQLPALESAGPQAMQAPVLLLDNVFEPELIERLVAYYEERGGEDSGFMREVSGLTTRLTDHSHKRRRDCLISDQKLIDLTRGRVNRRIAPEIAKAYQFKVTRMERYIVACYMAEEGGHFRPHRDNTTKGTAHRRFAVSINLNDAFDGGEISFPEYGLRSYRPSVGGALVFSCSLMHAVSKVRSGKRYAFLPFLYDDDAAKLRAANNQYLDPAVQSYTGTQPRMNDENVLAGSASEQSEET